MPPTAFKVAEAQPSRFCLTVSNHTTVPGWAVAGRTRGSPVGPFVGAGVVSGDVGAEVDVGAIDPRRVRNGAMRAGRNLIGTGTQPALSEWTATYTCMQDLLAALISVAINAVPSRCTPLRIRRLATDASPRLGYVQFGRNGSMRSVDGTALMGE